MRAGEPLAGSAGRVRAWFGIEWPKPEWHPGDASGSRGLPPEIAELEASEKRAGRKLAVRVFQRSPHPPTGAPELLALEPRTGRCERAARVPLEDLAPTLERFLSGGSIGAPLERPTVLICTDGRHDRCCAAHGHPLFQALRGMAAERRPQAFDVAEASHLGGHRFASTVLALPEGRLYGRIPQSSAPSLARAVVSGSVLVEHDRGRLGQSEVGQVAEAAVRSRRPGVVHLRVEDRAAEQNEAVSVHVVDPESGAEFDVRCRRVRFASLGTCGVEADTRMRWVADRVVDRR